MLHYKYTLFNIQELQEVFTLIEALTNHFFFFSLPTGLSLLYRSHMDYSASLLFKSKATLAPLVRCVLEI